jgi:ABC-2 type transport system permease protein
MNSTFPIDSAARQSSPSLLRRYFGIYAALWKNSVVREMGFKGNFLLWIVVELLWFALQLSFMAVIYQHTDHIADWTKYEVILLIGASHFIQQLFQAIFLTNCTALPEQIRTGKLDFILLLPVNTRFMLSLRQVDLGGFVNGASAAGVVIYALHKLAIVPSLLDVIGFILLAITGVLIHYSLMFLLSSISFWTVRAQGIVWGYYSLFNIARLPDSAFHGIFRRVFTFALPMLLVANVPARLLAQKLHSPLDMLLLLGMAVVCMVVSELGWRFALKHYTSASS